jgi:hypothetical protein
MAKVTPATPVTGSFAASSARPLKRIRRSPALLAGGANSLLAAATVEGQVWPALSGVGDGCAASNWALRKNAAQKKMPQAIHRVPESNEHAP